MAPSIFNISHKILSFFPLSSPSNNTMASFLPSNTIFAHKKPNFFHNRVSCNATNNDQSPLNLDRRNLLLRLGGLYSSGLGSNALALAAPIITPDPSKSGAPKLPTGVDQIDCCLPSKKVIDFKFPPPSKILRTRPAAQFLTTDYIEKYERATALMRALPKDNPHSFMQQAAIHCAYCDSSYEQVGFPDLKIDVHFSWLFFPFHRWYLYFHEKILGKLINDPSFALPFWNWDAPSGMQIPSIYTNTNSPLYDHLRSSVNQPPAVIDLNYDGKPSSIVGDRLIQNNLSIMYRQMVSGSKTPMLFHGNTYRAGGDQDQGMGAIENSPHTAVHRWTGDSNQPNVGRFYSAGRDPIFYAHSNVDRMWTLWKDLPGKKRKDLIDPDWLNSSFIFYDENKQLVRVKVQDCLDNETLGYNYQTVDIPWLKSRPTPRRKPKKMKNKAAGVANAAEIPKTVRDFPVMLDKVVQVIVPRPKTSRSLTEKEEEEEVLVVDDIVFDRDEFVKFDVFINEDEEEALGSGPEKSELAGSFTNVPHKKAGRDGKKMKTCLRLGIGELLQDLKAEDDDSLVVTLVPRAGLGLVSIGGVKIELES